MDAIEISRSGMDVEWRRLEVIAENIANANTTQTAQGGAYRAQRLLSGPRVGFETYMQNGSQGRAPVGVQVYGVEPVNAQPRRVYEPTHPNADAEGCVSYPAFDQVSEMTNLVKTSRAYEANIVAINAARQMYSKALELGKR